jgi:hypothetical protein
MEQQGPLWFVALTMACHLAYNLARDWLRTRRQRRRRPIPIETMEGAYMSKANPRFRRANAVLPVLTTPAYMVTAFGTMEAGIWLCNFGYIASAPGQTLNSESNIATSWLNTNAVALRGCMSSIWSLTGCKVTCVTTPSRIPFTNTTNANLGVGTVISPPFPSTVAGIISKATATKGQHGRGRNYIGGVPTAYVSSNVNPDVLNIGGVTAYNTFIATVDGAGTVDGATLLTLAILQRVPKGAAVTNGQTVQTVTLRTLLGNVRRRRFGRGK